MTKGLLIVSLVIVLILFVCPIAVTYTLSKKEKNKEVFKSIMSIVSIVDLIAIILLLALWIGPIKDKDLTFKTNTTTTTTSAGSTELSEAGFNEINMEQYLSLISSSEKSIVLVARPTCYYCQQFTPILKQAMEEMNLTINYIDTDKFTSDDYEKFSNSLDYIKNNEWGTPLTLIVQNGEAIDVNNGYVELNTIKEFFTKNGFGE